MQGTVKRLVKDKKYGFILGEDRKEYFFHKSALKNCNYDDLQEGREVTFEDEESDKGSRAADIYV